MAEEKKTIAKPVARKVREHIKEDLAASEAGKHGIITKIADDYGVDKHVVEYIQKVDKVDIMAMREEIAKQSLMLANRNLERMSECLEDDGRMAKTPLKDFALSNEKLVGAAVTAIDGHQQVGVKIDFGALKGLRGDLDIYDRTMKLAKGRTL